MQEQEVWVDIKGFEGSYQVSNLGRVKSLARRVKINYGIDNYRPFPEKIMKPFIVNKKYYGLIIYKDKKYHHVVIHRLVAQHFITNPDNLPVVNHLDNNGFNNHVSNLEWTTVMGNTQHAIAIGALKLKGEDNPMAKYNKALVLKIREMYSVEKMRICNIARQLDLPTKYIDLIVHRKRWKHL
jgi:hypothetical protein